MTKQNQTDGEAFEVNVVYATTGDVELHLDIFRPIGPSRETAVLLLHGGGWRGGDRSFMHGYAKALAAMGFTALAVQYRLLGQAAWPSPLDDVATAVAWTRDNAKMLGVRSDRIVLEGFSAGAHLALMTAGRTPGVSAVVAFFPPVAFSLDPKSEDESDIRHLLGPDATADAANEVSPVTYVSADFPPTFLLHGSADWLVSPLASVRLYRELSLSGVRAELHIFAGEQHEFSMMPHYLEPVQREVADFLGRHVVDPAGHAAHVQAFNPFAKGPPSGGAPQVSRASN
jgi:acetyl esterase/lipase